MKEYTIRKVIDAEIDEIAGLISTGYFEDDFFKWVVNKDIDRYEIVKNYYKIYLSAKGTIAHVIERFNGDVIGVGVWLPHDVDLNVYQQISVVTKQYAQNFNLVAQKSHDSEPPGTPFYQLVAIVIKKEFQGRGLAAHLLGSQLEQFDQLGVPTYLEASTPYLGQGIYAKFGYQPIGELMKFPNGVKLYPLWRSVFDKVEFAGYQWLVLERYENKMLLLSEKVIELKSYHDRFESINWSKSTIRKYLNDDFYECFLTSEKKRVLETTLQTSENPWFKTGQSETTTDKLFLLSVDETLKYFGDIRQLKNFTSQYCIDDNYNHQRKAKSSLGTSVGWHLRTSGKNSNLICTVMQDGQIAVSGDFVNRKLGVRPAMWIIKEEKNE